MNRMEFIEKLQRALAGGLNSNQVADNVRYYQEYIDMEIRKGKSETDVLAGLGDPRLLAKSIIEANKHTGMNQGTNRTFDEEMSGTGNTYGSSYGSSAYSGGTYSSSAYGGGQTYETHEGKENGRVFRVPGWLILLIVTVVVILIIGVTFSLISVLAPILIPVLFVILLIRIFRSDT